MSSYSKYLPSSNRQSTLSRLNNKNITSNQKQFSNINTTSNILDEKPSKLVGNNIIFNSNTPKLNISNTNKTSDENMFSIKKNTYASDRENDIFSNNEFTNKNSKYPYDSNIGLNNDKSEKERLEKLIKMLKDQITSLEFKNGEKDRLLREKEKKIKDLTDSNKKLENEIIILKGKLKNKHNRENLNKNGEDEELAIALAKIEEMERNNSNNTNNTNKANRSTSVNNRFNNPIGINFEPSDVIDVDLLGPNSVFNELFGNINRHPNISHVNEIDPISEYENHIINELCPNPDNMTYEQLLELGDKVGTVSKGFSRKEIDKIPSIRFNKNLYKNSDRCTICQFDFTENEILRKLTCGHIYHKHCVDEWLLKEKQCPVCKMEVKIK